MSISTKEETLEFRAGRQRLFDLIESMTGFTCLEDDMSEIEQVVLSYASDMSGVVDENNKN